MQFKFITLNLWLGGVLFDAILDFLKKEKPDILVCQEVYNGKDKNLEKKYRSFETIKKELGFSAASFALAFYDNRDKIGKIENGNAIFSKFPIIAEKTAFFDMPFDENYIRKDGDDSTLLQRNMQLATLLADKAKLNIFNIQGIWGFMDGGDNERRLKMGKTIVEEIKNKENVILAGDFNLNPDTKTVAGIEKYLKNVFKDELTTSFNMKRKEIPGYAKAVADMVFVSSNIKILEHHCPQVDISDHLPLVCRLKI